MNRFERAVLCAVPLGMVGTEVVAQLLGLHRHPLAMMSPYYTFPAFTASAIATAMSTLRRREWAMFLVLSIGLEVAKTLFQLAHHRSPLSSWTTMGVGTWYASVALSAWSIATGPRSERLREFDLGLVRLTLPIGIALSMFGLWLTGEYVGSTYDNFFYAFDGLLSGDIAQRLAEWCGRSPPLRMAAFVAYQSFLLIFSLALYAQCRGGRDRAGPLMARWVLIGLGGWALYFVLPGIGPYEAFYSHAVWAAAPSSSEIGLSLMQVDSDTPRNAMPSLHMAWAVLLVITGWEMGRGWFAAGILYFALTVFATLGLAEHYLIDLVVAVPFAIAIGALPALFDHDQPRTPYLAAVIGGALLTGLLLVVVRFGTGPLRQAAWLADLISIGVVLGSLALYPGRPPGRRRQRGRRPGLLRQSPLSADR
jgi:hypothetical protein